jgi:hypothetical protein
MTRKYDTEALTRIADVAIAPAPRETIDRTFELPTGLYAATVGAYLAFLGIMAAGFQSRDMILPMAIFTIYIVMAFGVPMLWARMNPANPSRALSWSRFEQEGIETWAGHISAKDAKLQVLILPVLVLLWGVAVVTIAAFV